jgi:hypothetical protein
MPAICPQIAAPDIRGLLRARRCGRPGPVFRGRPQVAVPTRIRAARFTAMQGTGDGRGTDSFLSQTAPTLMSDRIRTSSWLSERYRDLIDGLEGEGTAHLGSGGAGPRGQERGLDDLVDPGPVHEVVADECLFVPARLEHHHGRATRAEGSDLATK